MEDNWPLLESEQDIAARWRATGVLWSACITADELNIAKQLSWHNRRSRIYHVLYVFRVRRPYAPKYAFEKLIIRSLQTYVWSRVPVSVYGRCYPAA